MGLCQPRKSWDAFCLYSDDLWVTKEKYAYSKRILPVRTQVHKSYSAVWRRIRLLKKKGYMGAWNFILQ